MLVSIVQDCLALVSASVAESLAVFERCFTAAELSKRASHPSLEPADNSKDACKPMRNDENSEEEHVEEALPERGLGAAPRARNNLHREGNDPSRPKPGNERL